jgi:hypothetical protein
MAIGVRVLAGLTAAATVLITCMCSNNSMSARSLNVS